MKLFPRSLQRVGSKNDNNPSEFPDTAAIVHLEAISEGPSASSVSVRELTFAFEDGKNTTDAPCPPPPALSAGDILFFPRGGGEVDAAANQARRGLVLEKELTPLACCRQYPRAIMWSMVLFLTVVMEAYGKVLITGFFVFPEFKRRFGQAPISSTVPEEGEYEISPMWQMGLQNAAVACEIIGLLANGYVTDLLGYRKAMMLCLAWMLLATFPAVFASNIGLLLASQALSGRCLDPLLSAHIDVQSNVPNQLFPLRCFMGCYSDPGCNICC